MNQIAGGYAPVCKTRKVKPFCPLDPLDPSCMFQMHSHALQMYRSCVTCGVEVNNRAELGPQNARIDLERYC